MAFIRLCEILLRVLACEVNFHDVPLALWCADCFYVTAQA